MCMCICMCMGTKTISVMEDAYNMLVNKKHKNESFSEVIRRMAGKKKDIMKFAGVWKDMSDKEVKSMKMATRSLRRKSTIELLKKLKEDDMHRF